MRTSEVADGLLGSSEDDKANANMRKFLEWFLGLLSSLVPVESLVGKVKLSWKLSKQINIHGDGMGCQNKETTGAGGGTNQVNFNIDDKYHQNKSSGDGSFYVGDQCHHPQCLMNKSRDKFLEVLLMVSSFLLSFATAGAFYFTQALTIVGSHDPVLKHSLAAFKWIFTSSFLCNFLGVVVCLILQSCPEYHPYKKFSLIISNAASFLFMVLGYGLLITFNISRS